MSEPSKNEPSQKASRRAKGSVSKEAIIKETPREPLPTPGQRMMGTLLPTLQPTIVPTLATTSIYGGGYSTIATILSTNIPIVTLVYRAAGKKEAPKRKASRKRR